MTFTEQQLKEHSASILKWLDAGKPPMLFRRGSQDWTSILGDPEWCRGNEYKLKPIPQTLWVNSYNNGAGMHAHPSKTDAMQASRSAPVTDINYKAKEFVEVL